MMVNSFINQPDESIKRPGGVAPAYQSFTERKKLERQRRIVRAYRDSLLGSGYGPRGEGSTDRSGPVERMRKNESPTRQEANTRLSVNAKPVGGVPGSTPPASQRFTEPPTRSYNPYS